MFKHIVYRDGYFFLRRWTPFGWEYWDSTYSPNGYWWPIKYIHHATKFNNEVSLRETWDRLKKKKENARKSKFQFWSWL